MTDVTVTDEIRAIFAKWRGTGHILLHAGEMKAQELRSVKAVLQAVEHEVAAALSAALPLVVAGEREWAAKIADAHSLQSEIERKVERKRGGAEWIAHKRAEAIAAAIRADTGGETGDV